MKFSEDARLAQSIQHGEDTFEHVYHAPQIAALAQPGQFVHVRVADTLVPLLRRPISILGADAVTGMMRVLFKVVRKGTAVLAQRNEEETMEVVGPLGNPFPWDAERDAVMIAGGYGVSPVLFLARKHRAQGRKCTLIYGARTAADLLLTDEIERTFDEVIYTTNDGSRGEQGIVSQPLERLLATEPNSAIYACGPTPMLRAVAQVALAAHPTHPDIPCWVSMENRMGCGLGVCGGCVVPATNGKYITVCKDGPVFDARAINFAAM